jgi:cytochrome b561
MVDQKRQSGPAGEYSSAAKWFHWLTLPPIVIMLLSGPTIHFIKDDAKMSFYTLHESLGLLVLTLAAARLAWRVTHPPPSLAPDIPPLERFAANTVHNLLYVALITQPILGFFTTNAYGFPQRGETAFLGFINLPKFMEASPDLALRLHWAHAIVGGLLALLIVAHVGGVLFRHVGRRDGTLLRML